MSSSGFEQRFEDHINELRLFSSCEDRDFEEIALENKEESQFKLLLKRNSFVYISSAE